jgi:RNA polymerase sigma factor (sigma-70 family)
MTPQEDRLRLDRSLARRMRRSDQSVLADILNDLAPEVKSRLRKRYGGLLNEHDWDDLASMGLYRLWMSRKDYDRDKGTLANWFYLITRSLVWDFLRKRRHEIQVRSDITRAEFVQASPLRENHAPRSDDLARLIVALDALADIDRQILLAFAANGPEGDWTSDLVAELGMPASTIRVRKFRATAELRDILCGKGSPSSKVERAMIPTRSKTTLSEPPKPSGVPDVYADLVREHWEQIQEIGLKLRDLRIRRAEMDARGGLVQVESEWNAALGDESKSGEHKADPRNLEGLEQTYGWLTALAIPNHEHRNKLGGFLQILRSDRKDAPNAIDEEIGDLEQALSTVTTQIELKMPDDVCRAGEGWVELEYLTNDVSLRWQGNPRGSPLLLRKLVKSALASTSCFHGPAGDAIAELLVKRIIAGEKLLLPNFYYPSGSKTLPPQRLDWRCAETPVPQSRETLPTWMRDRKYAPTIEEVALFHDEPNLAERLDKLATEAALVDWLQQKDLAAASPGPDGDAPSKMGAVQSLLDAIVQTSGLTKSEVAAVLAPKLLERQEDVNSPRECAANTSALALLWCEVMG